MKCLEVLNNEKPLWILGHERATVVNVSISLDCQTSETAACANAFITRRAQLGELESICTEKVGLTGSIEVRVVEVDTADNVWCDGKEASTAPHQKPHALCSFCGKSYNDPTKIIAGPNVFICNECVKLCHEIVSYFDQGDA